MTRVVWLTDIHLNFLTGRRIDAYLASVRSQNPDVVLISGDIGEAPTVVNYLRRIEAGLQRPIYIVE